MQPGLPGMKKMWYIGWGGHLDSVGVGGEEEEWDEGDGR